MNFAKILNGLPLALALVLSAMGVQAQNVKIAYIDPLSGGGASVGEHGLKHLQFLVDAINTKGGVINGQKMEAVAYDNKGSPQESLVQVQKAIDAGVRFITQGNGSGAAIAISEFISKYNDRNPGKEVLYFNYSAVDPALTNEKCSYWHFRWDANSDIKMAALTDFMKSRKEIKKVYIIGQDESIFKAYADTPREWQMGGEKCLQRKGEGIGELVPHFKTLRVPQDEGGAGPGQRA